MPYVPLVASPDDLRQLRGWVAAAETRPSLRLRARMVLLLHAGGGPVAVARRLGCSVQTVVVWRDRFRAAGIDGLHDARRSGRPVSVDPAGIIRATLQTPADGARRWTSRSLAEHLGVSNVTVANVWRTWGLRPGGPHSVVLQLDPVLDRPPVEVVGLHVDGDVRIVALLVDGGPVAERAPEPPPHRIGVGTHLPRLLAGTPAGTAADVGEARRQFLRAVEELPARSDSAGEPSLRLVAARRADADLPSTGGARGRTAPAVHVVPPPLEWDKVVRVACALVGRAEPAGPASIGELCRAIDRDASRGCFSWVRG